jgi:predicted DCC family thiol-disulfide oxidoreductase YuxK
MNTSMESSSKKIVLFDGVCNLCNGAVRFIIRRDHKDCFRFCSLQSELGISLCKERHIDTTKTDSIILIDPGKAYYIKSTAVIEIAKSLRGYKAIAILLGLLPTGFLDSLYDLIAKNRFKWFGKKSACMLPSPELKEKFL